jgi:hypothetical protein
VAVLDLPGDDLDYRKFLIGAFLHFSIQLIQKELFQRLVEDLHLDKLNHLGQPNNFQKALLNV